MGGGGEEGRGRGGERSEGGGEGRGGKTGWGGSGQVVSLLAEEHSDRIICMRYFLLRGGGRGRGGKGEGRGEEGRGRGWEGREDGMGRFWAGSLVTGRGAF